MDERQVQGDVGLGLVLHNALGRNDHAEVALAKIYGIEPFKQRASFGKVRAKGTNDGMKCGFIFHKDNLPAEIPSAFYCPLSITKNKKEKYYKKRWRMV